MDEAENHINDLELKEAKEQPIRETIRKKNKKKNKDSLRCLWDNVKRSNIFIQEYQKDKRKSKKLEIYLKK